MQKHSNNLDQHTISTSLRSIKKTKEKKCSWLRREIVPDGSILRIVFPTLQPCLVSIGITRSCFPNNFFFFKKDEVIAPCGCYHPQGINSEGDSYECFTKAGDDNIPSEQCSTSLYLRNNPTKSRSNRLPYNIWYKLLLLLSFILVLNCAEMPVYREEIFYPKIEQPAVTVKLLETDQDIVITPKESFVIRYFHRKGDRSVYYASASIRVGVSGDGIVLSESTQGKIEANLNKVSFSPKKDDSYLFLNGKPYRGTLEVVLSQNNPKSLLVLNAVWVEDYLKGVVPAEIGKLGEEETEALKAQAIAARTYSLSRLGQYEDSGYDLEASVMDQVYNGVDGEDALVNEAVKQTAGKVIAYQGKLINAYYHANSGGKTEYIEDVWGKAQVPYLISVEDDDFCSWAKNYSWEEIWSKKDLERNLSAYLDSFRLLPARELGDLIDLVIKERSPSGRIQILEVVTDSRTYQIYKDKIRWALRRGSDADLILPSTLFDLEIERRFDNSIISVTARGHGNGHGVGMCQTGAIGMARKGYSYEDILTHYYPGVKIIKCD